jgi:dihydrofolate reductase
MRTLAITQNVTLDGAIEMLDDWFDDRAQGGEGNEDLLEENERQDAAADALLVGRRTFEDFRGYWRDLEGDTTGISDYLNRVHKYVVSSTITEPDWEPTTILATDPIESVRSLKEEQGWTSSARAASP